MPEPKQFDEDTGAPTHGLAITDAANVGATYSQAEVNAIVSKFNALLAACRSAGIIAQD